MTSITPSIVFDLVQVGAGVQIKNTQNDEPYFVLKFEKKGGLFRRRKVTTIHRAPIDAQGTLPHHFAQWDKKRLEIVKKMPQGSKEKPGISKTHKVNEFLRKHRGSGLLDGWAPGSAAMILYLSDSFIASADTFYVDHKAYQLVKSAGRTLELFAGSDLQTPLALFREHSNFSSAIASIRIYTVGVGLDVEDQEGCLVWDGEPTKLMEQAVIAERLYNSSQPWWARL